VENSRVIALIDINSMFASCHQSVEPTLRGKPVIVGGSMTDKRKGLVIAASYEAKAKGIKTTMSVFEARKLCPEAIFVGRDHSLYGAISSKIMDFLRLIGPTEVASIDEAYVDLTDRIKNGEDPLVIARYIQRVLYQKIHIPCSIGLGENRIIAKMSSEVKKPLGITMFGRKQYQTFFYRKHTVELYGCGEATAEKLEDKLGIKTIGDLAHAEPHSVRLILGKRGEWLRLAAQGISSDIVDPDREKGEKTIGKETTFQAEVSDSDQILRVARQMAERLSNHLKEKQKKARTVSLVYKTERLGRSHSKSKTLNKSADEPGEIMDAVSALYSDHLWETPLHLFGIRLSNFQEEVFEQLTMDEML
jgi:DNA polymerase IV